MPIPAGSAGLADSCRAGCQTCMPGLPTAPRCKTCSWGCSTQECLALSAERSSQQALTSLAASSGPHVASQPAALQQTLATSHKQL